MVARKSFAASRILSMRSSGRMASRVPSKWLNGTIMPIMLSFTSIEMIVLWQTVTVALSHVHNII